MSDDDVHQARLEGLAEGLLAAAAMLREQVNSPHCRSISAPDALKIVAQAIEGSVWAQMMLSGGGLL